MLKRQIKPIFAMMNHEFYMQRCLDIAASGMGKVSPNPMVGCVIVHDNLIIGEGYHQEFGTAHAEVNAINAVLDTHAEKAPQLLKEATAYVNLEPCAHFGKTPPCADLLIRHGLKTVVIANLDPFYGVNGKGISKLREAGIEVLTGVFEEEAAYLNRRFFTRITQQRPYLILKWAQTSNGFFAPIGQKQQWISGPESKILVHQWRADEDAILVGKNTVINDNPQLNTREVNGKNAIRIVIDKNLSIPNNYNIYNDAAKTIIFNEVKTEVIDNIHFVQMEDMHFYLAQKIAFQLYLMDIQSVIVEGGTNILQQFISANLWDEARVFTSIHTWENGLKAPKIGGELLHETQIGNDKLTIFKRKHL